MCVVEKREVGITDFGMHETPELLLAKGEVSGGSLYKELVMVLNAEVNGKSYVSFDVRVDGEIENSFNTIEDAIKWYNQL